MEIIRECLSSLHRTTGVELEIVIVDNGSGEDPSQWGVDAFERVQVLRFKCKLGFAGACNRGVEASRGDFVFLFNNDAVTEPNAVEILARRLVEDPSVAATVPKILWYFDPAKFDYSSAAGGLIDRYGIPFARGRIFDHLEDDRGQFDRPAEVFWGAGAALMVRRRDYLEAGGLEEPFFAHMEEIDLLWRFQLMGMRVEALPSVVVRHRGAVTITSGSPLKLYLNHRNSILMMIRNYSALSLMCYLPLRIAMDAAFGLFSLLRLDFRRCWAILRAGVWILGSPAYLIKCRRRAQRLRRVPDGTILGRMFPGPLAWYYFIRGCRTYEQLLSAVPERHHTGLAARRTT